MGADRPWTILRTLDWVQSYFQDKGLETPRLDAEVILAYVLETQRVMLYARFDQPLHPPELARIKALVARRARREPIAHLVGTKEFWSIELLVNEGCLVPRPDSETIIEVALALTRGKAVRTVVDVGTGSGCLALAAAHEWPEATIYALEASAPARAVAEQNAARARVEDRVIVLESDLLAGLPADAGPVDVLIANLPYVPTEQIDALMPDVRFFEPRIALDGGPDGLALYRRMIDQLGPVLGAEAVVVCEAGADQVDDLARLFEAARLGAVSTHADAAGLPRVAAVTRRPPG